MTITRFSYARLGGRRQALHITQEQGLTLCHRKITKLWNIRHRKASDRICATCLRKDLNR